ncbi:MAG TPA: hypothetical protein VHX61_12610 [Rhizomicrobium sp.]|jgi:hypothetical protein|nr:hypothetical protein [Rhizomicrobium sp.]
MGPFHIEIYRVHAHGEDHITNMSDPQIPAALAPAIGGIAWLNDFRAKPQFTGQSECQSYVDGQKTSTGYVVVPADLWKIYNFPVFHLQRRRADDRSGGGRLSLLSGPSYDQDWCSFRTNFLEKKCSADLFSVQNPGDCNAPMAAGSLRLKLRSIRNGQVQQRLAPP